MTLCALGTDAIKDEFLSGPMREMRREIGNAFGSASRRKKEGLED